MGQERLEPTLLLGLLAGCAVRSLAAPQSPHLALSASSLRTGHSVASSPWPSSSGSGSASRTMRRAAPAPPWNAT
eukprot:6851114-Lingulodinium_polyedra.AAC.1